jgi:hypothetical protein
MVNVVVRARIPNFKVLKQVVGMDVYNGIAFIDATSLRVCENIRIPRHKTFKEEAGRGKSLTGWFYGFKLHCCRLKEQ